MPSLYETYFNASSYSVSAQIKLSQSVKELILIIPECSIISRNLQAFLIKKEIFVLSVRIVTQTFS